MEIQTLSRSGRGRDVKAYTIPRVVLNGVRRGMTRLPMNSSTEIRITRLCTQRCRQCSVYDRKTDPPSLSLEQFRIIARKLKSYGAYIGFISGGEPTLVGHLDEILLEARRTFPLSTTLVSGLFNQTEKIKAFGNVALANDIHIQTSLDGLGDLGDNLRGSTNFSETVLRHMAWLSKKRRSSGSSSLLYANIVLNNLNLDQVPELIRRAVDLGWKTTIGVYHNLTRTTRADDELRLRPGIRLDRTIDFLLGNPNILNLDVFIAGIPEFVKTGRSSVCAFVDAPVLATRTTVMEDGNVHLCFGPPIGNLFDGSMEDIFRSRTYRDRLETYKSCSGCWTTCYTQRLLLIRPDSIRMLRNHFSSLLSLRPGRRNGRTDVRR